MTESDLPVVQMRPYRWGDPAHHAELPGLAREALAALGARPAPPPVDPDQARLPDRRLPEPVLQALAEAVGEAHVHTDHAARVGHTRGWSLPDLLALRAGDASDAPDAVVFPGSHDEVVRALQICSDARVAVIPYAGGTSVVDQIVSRSGVSLRLLLIGSVIGAIVGVTLGVWGAVRQYKFSDQVVTYGSYLVFATPTFVIGVLLMIGATALNGAAGMQLINFTGEYSAGLSGSWWDLTADRAVHLLLPTVALVLIGAFLHGFGLEIFSVGWDLAIQENVAPEMLARVYSFDQLGSFIARPLGLALTGVAAGATSDRSWLLVVAVAMLVAEVAPFWIPDVRRLTRRATAAEHVAGSQPLGDSGGELAVRTVDLGDRG